MIITSEGEWASVHILITTPTFPPQGGGVAEVARKQQAYLSARGHTVEVVSGALEGQDPGLPGVSRFEIRAGRFPRYAAGDRWGIHVPAERARYLAFLRASPAQVILSHCWQAWNTDWAFAQATTLGKPLALFSHGTSVNTRSGWLGPLRWLRWREYAWQTLPRTLEAAAGVFMLEDLADDDRFLDGTIARRLGIPMQIVPNGCAAELLDQPAVGLDSQSPLVLCVGQYTPEKNPAAVVNAFAAVNQPDARLVVCGSSATGYLEGLRRQIGRLPVDVAVRISLEVGPTRERLLQLYRDADLVVSASVTECQPLVLLDAMGAGVPFLSTRVGCVEALPGGVVVNSAKDLVEPLRQLLADPEWRRKLGRSGRQAAATKYNWTSSLARLELGLLDIVASASSAGPH